MRTVAFQIEREDKEWIKQTCNDNFVDLSFSETDGFIGGDEWLQVVIPLATVSIPCLTKILIKLIDKYGPTKVTCGEITIDKVRQKEVPEVLEKMNDLQQKLNHSRNIRDE